MLYGAVFVKNIRLQMMYRSNFLLNIVGSLMFVYVQVAIWQALIGQRPEVSPLGLSAMITYIVAAYTLRQAARTNFFHSFERKVSSGSIALDMIRPVNLKNVMIAEQLSENVISILFSCLPVVLVAGFVWGYDVSANPAQLALFAVAAIFAVAIKFYMEYIFAMLVFWTRDHVYAQSMPTSQILSGLTTIFSGAVVPLWFYPEWLRATGMFLPFRLTAFEPIQIFLGTTDIAGALLILAQQLGWLGALWLIERFLWSQIKRNIFVQGG